MEDARKDDETGEASNEGTSQRKIVLVSRSGAGAIGAWKIESVLIADQRAAPALLPFLCGVVPSAACIFRFSTGFTLHRAKR